MKVSEIFNESYYDPQADVFNKRQPSDIRKPKLTLQMLNRLKKIRATNELEDLKRKKLVAVMYATE